MPVAYAFDGDVIVLRMSGSYATTDLKSAVLAALDDDGLPKRPALLMDLQESRSLQDRTADDVRDMARFLIAHAKRFGSRIAIVAPGDLGFGLMRLAAVATESGGVKTEVFRDAASAREWLER